MDFLFYFALEAVWFAVGLALFYLMAKIGGKVGGLLCQPEIRSLFRYRPSIPRLRAAGMRLRTWWRLEMGDPAPFPGKMK